MWQAQEPVHIIGFELSSWTRDETLIGNDGFAMSTGYLTPQKDKYIDGALGLCQAHQDWNTGFSASHPPYHVVVMFPEGYGVPLKEGESIVLQTIFGNTTSAPVGFIHHAHIYYVKG